MTLNRRNLIAGAAVLPALAAFPVVASAVAAPPVDPIFAVIAAHRAAEAEHEAACNAQCDLEDRLHPQQKTILRRPHAHIGDYENSKESRFAYSHEEIDEVVGRWLRGQEQLAKAGGKGMRPAKYKKLLARAHQALDRDTRHLKAKQDAIGWTAMEERLDRAGPAERAASMAMVRTVPTTMDGMSALLRYSIEYIDSGREWPNQPEDAPEFAESHAEDGSLFAPKDWNYILHRTLADALEKMWARPAFGNGSPPCV
jgi:hypothetical protein